MQVQLKTVRIRKVYGTKLPGGTRQEADPNSSAPSTPITIMPTNRSSFVIESSCVSAHLTRGDRDRPLNIA